jgi:ATP-binding cassette, subfamily C, bacterial
MTQGFRETLRLAAAYWRRVVGHAPLLFSASVAISLMTSLLEGVGLFMLVPILGLLGIGGGMEDGGAGEVFRRALASAGLSPTLESVLVLFLCLMFARGVLGWVQADVTARLTNGFMVAVRTETYDAVTRASWLHLASRRASEFTHAITTQADAVSEGAAQFMRLLTSAFSIVAGLAVALTLSPGLTLAALACAALIVLPMSVFDIRAYRIGSKGWAAMQAIYEQLSRHFLGLKAARVLSAEDRYRAEFRSLARHHGQQGIALSRNSATAGLIHSMAAAAMLCALIYIAVKSGASTVEPVLLAVIFARLLPRVQGMQYDIQNLLSVLPQFAGMDRLLGETRAAAEVLAVGGDELPAMKESIDVRNLRFRYGNGPLVLDGVSLQIGATGSTGLIGMSGAGKTTLADILAGLLIPAEGQILIDGKEVTASARPQWRRQVAYVTQEEFLFNDTVRANLTIAAPSTPEAALWKALEAAHAAAIVKSLPMGLDSVIGDRGTLLSRGQRQRLCLARALLSDPSLLILDEATSALNPVDEEEILKALKDTARFRAVLVIAHRISTVAWTDRIIVMGQAGILEQGTLSGLQQTPGSLVQAMASLEKASVIETP